jgi:hypothetical protein
MIDPHDPADVVQLSESMSYWYQEHARYRVKRREMILHHAGSEGAANSLGINNTKPMYVNLQQMSAIAHMVALAYGEPRWQAVARVPAAENLEESAVAFLDRYSELVNLGDIARQLAMDSFFGYAIAAVGRGFLTPAARMATGMNVGPMCWRISQSNFMFDGDASQWDQTAWQAHFCFFPLKQIKTFQPFLDYNQEGVENLEEYTYNTDSADSGKIHASGGRRSAMKMTRLVRVFLPFSNLETFWPANQSVFAGITGEPLFQTPFKGHHSGLYSVMNLLDIPDQLIPVTQSEGTLKLHTLFNELADITARQAVEAKFNPTYEIGSHRDAKRLETATDRKAVGLSSLNKVGSYEVPGPTQSQTAYMGSIFSLFKEASLNLDDVLGTGPTAKTVGQSQLIRQATGNVQAEKKRRMTRLLTNIGQKLLHLAMNDDDLYLPIRGTLGNTDLPIDLSWLPYSQSPRTRNADDLKLDLIPGSLEYRDPAMRLQQFNAAVKEILGAVSAALQGAPIDIPQFIELQAKYNDLPELRRVFAGVLQEYKQKKENAEISQQQREGVGEYVRHNVSEQSNQGALEQNLTQFSDGPSEGGMRVG